MTLRKTPLNRKAPMKAKPRRRKVSEEGAAYMAWVREQACVFACFGNCRGPVHAHHHGRKGLSQKVPDEQCVPLCEKHHQAEWHDTGTIAGLDRNEADAAMWDALEGLRAEWRVSRPTPTEAEWKALEERNDLRAEGERLRDVLNELAAGLPRDDVWATLTRDDVEGWVMETARAALKGGSGG